jgi:hypothetical protein
MVLVLGLDYRGRRFHKQRRLLKNFFAMLFRREQRVAGFENEYESIDDNALYKDKYFGVHPFMISTGEVEIPDKIGFKLSAPTTGMESTKSFESNANFKAHIIGRQPWYWKDKVYVWILHTSSHLMPFIFSYWALISVSVLYQLLRQSF